VSITTYIDILYQLMCIYRIYQFMCIDYAETIYQFIYFGTTSTYIPSVKTINLPISVVLAYIIVLSTYAEHMYQLVIYTLSNNLCRDYICIEFDRLYFMF